MYLLGNLFLGHVSVLAHFGWLWSGVSDYNWVSNLLRLAATERSKSGLATVLLGFLHSLGVDVSPVIGSV